MLIDLGCVGEAGNGSSDYHDLRVFPFFSDTQAKGVFIRGGVVRLIREVGTFPSGRSHKRRKLPRLFSKNEGALFRAPIYVGSSKRCRPLQLKVSGESGLNLERLLGFDLQLITAPASLTGTQSVSRTRKESPTY